MQIENYLISTANLDSRRILKEWRWLVGEMSILSLTKAGDILLKDSLNKLWFLDVGNGNLKLISNNRTKYYDWQTVAQRCYYFGYSEYKYPNDTTVIAKTYDRNDSLAIVQTNVFDNKANILKVTSLMKKRATGWGIDVTFYSYDGNETETHLFNYKFDDRNNWIERIEYVNDTIRLKTTRLIKYKN